MKLTSLYQVHQQLGARLVEFGGWEMPLYYSGIIQEHLAVRNAAGLFDISHMGEFLISGKGAPGFLNYALTNDAGKLSVGAAQYTLICNQQGGLVDDTYLYRLEAEKFLLIVNASRIEADFQWLGKVLKESSFLNTVALKNVSDELGAIAIQGPKVKEFFGTALEIPGQGRESGVLALQKNQVGTIKFQGNPLWVARTGYTGEDGFEIVGATELMPAIWAALLETGRTCGLVPAGLGARDTLRTEMCYPLYGHELDETTTPLEAGLGFFVAFEKGDFIGRAQLLEQKNSGPAKRLAAFRMSEKSAPPRPGYPIWSCGGASEKLGVVTSGTQSPSLNCGIGLGYLRPDLAKPNTGVEIEIRDKRAPAMVVAKPIYRKAS